MSVIESPAPPTTRPAVVPPVADLLERAADLLGEFGHCKFATASDDTGAWVGVGSDDAVAFCLYGAYYRALWDFGQLPRDAKSVVRLPFEVVSAASEVLEPLGGIAWNNASERTPAEVIARLRAAAEKARA